MAHAFKSLFNAHVSDESSRVKQQKKLAAHWKRIESDGVTAEEFVAFLEPLADLQGLTVSAGTESTFFSLRDQLTLVDR